MAATDRNVGNRQRLMLLAAAAALLGYAWRRRSRPDTTHALSGDRGVFERPPALA